MKSFQKGQETEKSIQLLKYRDQKRKNCQLPMPRCTEITRIDPNSTTKIKIIENNSKHDGEYKAQLKTLVQLNEQYFRNKIQIEEDSKPNNLKLKIPSKTGSTNYSAEFYKKIGKRFKQIKSHDHYNVRDLQIPFRSGTQYEAEYVEHKQQKKLKKVKTNKTIDENAPISGITKYSNTYLDWGVKNTLPPMKPMIKCSATNFNFQANSLYKENYKGKGTRPYSPQKIEVSQKTKNLNKKYSKAFYPFTTTNQWEFGTKNSSESINCKPKHETINPTIFKGKTEYQKQFISGGIKKDIYKQCSFQELQHLIVEL